MGLTRRRFSGLWVPVLLGLGGCTGRTHDGAGGQHLGSPTANETTDGPPGVNHDTTGTASEAVELTGSPRSTGSTARTSHPALSSTLSDLLTADAAAEYAREQGLTVDGSAVLVVVELVSADAELPSEHVRSVELRQGVLVRAYVPFGSLGPLASDDAVRFVRPPISGSTTNETGISS